MGGRFPVAAVANKTLHEVSDDSSATVTLVATDAVAALPVQDPEEPDELPVTLPVRFPLKVVAVRVPVTVAPVLVVSNFLLDA